MSRMRSAAEGDSYMYISCNPDPDCEWLLRMVQWYLDEEGFPDPEKDGVLRYFIRRGDDFVWGNSEQELLESHGKTDPATGELYPLGHKFQIKPISFTFISALIYDNPVMLETNPDYLAFLEGLNRVDRDRLLLGNWYSRAEGSNYWKREWVPEVDAPPLEYKAARAWDKASQEPSEVYKYPDYTASFKMLKGRDGLFYIVGDYCPTNHDKKEPEVFGRFRARPGERDQKILEQAFHDGDECQVVFSQDPGQSGKVEFQESAKKLIQEGFSVKADPMPSNKSKIVRFSPFASACEAGLVRIVPSTFPNKATYEHVLKELESFNGERSTSTRKDDIPDAAASCFNALAKQQVIPSFSLSYEAPKTKLAGIR